MRVLPFVVAASLLAACSQADTTPKPGQSTAPISRASSAPRERLLSWGSGPQQLGYQPAGHERLAIGPSAIAVLPAGDALVLDLLNRRVVKVRPEGDLVEVAAAASDAVDLAVDADGSFGVFSAMRSNVWVHNAQGKLMGEVQVPRGLRDIVSLGFGPSRRVMVRNAFQETYAVGGPNAPVSVETILEGKKEGAAFLPDGSGLAVQRTKQGKIELLVLGRDASGSRTAALRRIAVCDDAASARILRAWEQTVCLRIERTTSKPELEVAREAVCLRADNGEQTFHATLPGPGTFVPRTELAMGGSPPRLVMMHPRPEGLAVIAFDGVSAASEGRTP
ncbi:MAG: hypothetical protein HY898_23435 [Deltaproteobacteria bacterium]|nr:hypothetical protein [Deltaproteobacteria bacterium]